MHAYMSSLFISVAKSTAGALTYSVQYCRYKPTKTQYAGKLYSCSTMNKDRLSILSLRLTTDHVLLQLLKEVFHHLLYYLLPASLKNLI